MSNGVELPLFGLGTWLVNFLQRAQKWQICDFWAIFSSFLIFTKVTLGAFLYEESIVRIAKP
jgi:hypothetical protein